MVPAQTPLGKTAAVSKTRFCGIYVPHGATMDKWTPAQEGAGFEFTETLKPLEKLRDRVCVVSNLAHPSASGVGSDAGADHARSAAVFLSGAHPEKGSVHAGMTLDQVLAAAHRSGHAAAIHRTGHRGSRLELRLGLRLRLFQHHLLAHADAAAADGEQPAGGLRAAVRRWQPTRRSAFRGRSRTAAFSIPSPTKWPGCRASSIRATASASANISTTSAKSSGAFRRRPSSPPAS